MRILRVAQKLHPDVKGGGPYHVHAMSRDQAAMGHDVTVLTVRHDSSLPHFEEKDGYTVVRYDPTVTLLGNDVSVGVAQFLWDIDAFDVVHAHSHLYFSTNLAALTQGVERIPLAITNHGLYSQTAPEWLFDLYLRTIGLWTFNQADVVFCYTPEESNKLRRQGISSRIAVVPNGIDTTRFHPEGPTSELISSDQPTVLFVGRLVEGKRPNFAVRAIEHASERWPDTTLYLCGEGPMRSELESLATKIGVDDHVRFLGQVPYDEMPNIYRSADLLVQPSRTEGVPRTVLEAIACGTSVVANDLEQIRSIVKGNGRTVRREGWEPFATAVERELEQCAARPRDPAVDAQITDWSRTVEETTDVLESIWRGRVAQPGETDCQRIPR